MPNHFTVFAVCSPGYDFDCGDFNEQHKDTNLCAVVMPMPEPIEQVPSTSYPDGTTEAQRRGESTDWYDWAKEHWGTKWGTYEMQAVNIGGDGSPIIIAFQCAWGPPKILRKIAEWLKRVGKFESVVFIGFDPYDDSTKILEP